MQINTISNVHSNITTLPVEIIAEIMKVLDWRSVLTMRQTSKQFNIISRTRVVWLGQYYQYVTQRIYPTRLEEPPSLYSVEELERWVLLRGSADIGWGQQDLKFTRKRWIKVKEVGVMHTDGVCIVPGGRWLLVGGGDGSVTTYDLDAPTLEGSPLVLPAGDGQPVHHIAIDMDRRNEASTLTFTMALSAFDVSPDPLKFYIWKVSLMGHNAEARLSVNRLHTISAHNNSYIEGIALHGNIFARIHYRLDLPYIEVFDWEQSTPLVRCKGIIFPGVPIKSIRLLPGDRLLAFSDTDMMIYHLVIIVGAESAPPTIVPHITEPLWKIPLANARTFCGSLSQGLLTEAATYFIVKAMKTFREIAIPHDESQVPSIRDLLVLERPRDVTYAIGFEKAFIQHSDRSVVRLSCSWEAQEVDKGSYRVSSCFPVVLEDYPTTPNGVRVPKLDEETGRIVQDCSEGIMIIDTALLYTERENVSTS